MSKIWLILKREYVTRVRTKAFLWGTVALPLLTIGIFVFQIIMSTRQLDHTLKLAILDDGGGLAASIARRLTGRLPSGEPTFQVVKTVSQPASEEQSREELLDQIRKGELDGYLVVPKDAASGTAVEFHTKNPGNITMKGSINRAVSDAVVAERLSKWGVRASDVAQMTRPVDLKLFKITRHGESVEEGQTFLTAIIAGMLLYATLVVYGVATMRSVMEEKSTRIVEILVASVRPFYLLSGKILGVAAVALTQYLIWAAAGGLLTGYGMAMASSAGPGASMPKVQVPWPLLAYMVIFFLAGYLLYASLYAAVGAMVSTEQEAQQLPSLQRHPARPELEDRSRALARPLPVPHLDDPAHRHADAALLADRAFPRAVSRDHGRSGLRLCQDLPRGCADVRQAAVGGGVVPLAEVHVTALKV